MRSPPCLISRSGFRGTGNTSRCSPRRWAWGRIQGECTRQAQRACENKTNKAQYYSVLNAPHGKTAVQRPVVFPPPQHSRHAEKTHHSGFFTRSASVCLWRNSAESSFSAAAICSPVRCLMNTGLPRHFTVTVCPKLMLLRSTCETVPRRRWGVGARESIALKAREDSAFPQNKTAGYDLPQAVPLLTSTEDSASTSAEAESEETALMTARRAADAYKRRAPPKTKYVKARFSSLCPGANRLST